MIQGCNLIVQFEGDLIRLVGPLSYKYGTIT